MPNVSFFSCFDSLRAFFLVSLAVRPLFITMSKRFCDCPSSSATASFSTGEAKDAFCDSLDSCANRPHHPTSRKRPRKATTGEVASASTVSGEVKEKAIQDKEEKDEEKEETKVCCVYVLLLSPGCGSLIRCRCNMLFREERTKTMTTIFSCMPPPGMIRPLHL